MNILICDDMPEETAALDSLLQNCGFPVKINQFYKPLDVLNFISSGAVADLCFLDIVMPEMTGLALAAALRQRGYTGQIVFLSTSREYGPESYSVDAFSYLLKPPTLGQVKALLHKFQQMKNNADQAEITVKTGRITKVILCRNISYIEVIKHTVYFHMTDGSEVCVNATFSETAKMLLTDPRFIQCHRSYVVNMQDVAEISEKEILTRRGKRISIPRTYRSTRTKFYRWKFGSDE